MSSVLVWCVCFNWHILQRLLFRIGSSQSSDRLSTCVVTSWSVGMGHLFRVSAEVTSTGYTVVVVETASLRSKPTSEVSQCCLLLKPYAGILFWPHSQLKRLQPPVTSGAVMWGARPALGKDEDSRVWQRLWSALGSRMKVANKASIPTAAAGKGFTDKLER